MTGHVSTERMNEALDGLLTSTEMEQLEAHTDECEPCRNEYARLSEVVSGVRALPRGGEVPADAWEAIAARISDAPRTGDPGGVESGRASAGDVEAGVVVPFPSPRMADRPRMISLSVRQLASAAAVVAVLSAGSAWLVTQRRATGPELAVVGEESLAGAAARAVSFDGSRYGDVVDELEQILAEGRAVLAPETLLTIEESLRTVDEAIEEIEGALADDPNSDLLLRMLATHRSTKLGVLQRAATAVQAQT